jgi:hypothetical protein
MKMIYLDESGPSERVPWAVEAGIIVTPDDHHQQIENLMEEARLHHVPKVPQAAPFHASAVWNGNDHYKVYEEERKTTLRAYLKEVAEIPAKLAVPVVAGWINVGPIEALRKFDRFAPKAFYDAAPTYGAFVTCVLSAEAWLRQQADEVAFLIHEDTQQREKDLRDWQRRLRDKAIATGLVAGGLVPLERIRDELLFTPKDGSRMVQLADACAFLIGRQLVRLQDTAEIFDLISAQIIPPSANDDELFS